MLRILAFLAWGIALALIIGFIYIIETPSAAAGLSPVLCPQSSQLSVFQEQIIRSDYDVSLTCYDAAGAAVEDVTMKAFFLFVGGMIAFVLVGIGLYIASITPPAPAGGATVTSPAARVSKNVVSASIEDSIKVKLADLAAARDSGLLSETEYQQKRQEILTRF